MRGLAVDLFCGLGGWSDGLLGEGWDVIGFDVERHQYGEHRYPAQLVIQDVLALHGSQFRNVDLIVASPPCQEYSYMAMPWSRAKAKAAAIRADKSGKMLADLNRLFDACFRIQREACEASGRHIPMVVENVKGAQPWVGRARWNFGSFYLWGDVPALMPVTLRAQKFNPDGTAHPPGSWFAVADSKNRGAQTKNGGGSCFNVAHNTTSGKGQNPDGRKTRGHPNMRDGFDHTRHLTNPAEHEGVKQRGSGAAWFDKALDERRKNPDGVKNGGDWFGSGTDRSLQRRFYSKDDGTKNPGRQFASAMIAKIPLPLSRHIARAFRPQAVADPPAAQPEPEWPEIPGDLDRRVPRHVEAADA